MKTFRTVLLTGVVTILIGVIFVGKFLVDEGIVTFEKKGAQHERIVMVDGVVTEQSNWHELLGYTVRIDVKDSVYIGK